LCVLIIYCQWKKANTDVAQGYGISMRIAEIFIVTNLCKVYKI